jgi:primosomal protein N'
VQTAALAIPPEQIGRAVRALEKPSRRAALLAAVARAAEPLPLRDALRAAGATRDHVQKLADAGLIRIEDDRLVLAIPPREVDQRLAELRRVDKPLRILRMLAREAEPVDVSWVYAQADATLADLRRLEEAGLIALGEAQKWRDPLADREFIAMSPPRLTGEQAAAWETTVPAARRDRQRQDRDLPARHPAHAGVRAQRYLPRAGDRAHPADDQPGGSALPRSGGGRPQRPERGRTL